MLFRHYRDDGYPEQSGLMKSKTSTAKGGPSHSHKRAELAVDAAKMKAMVTIGGVAQAYVHQRTVLGSSPETALFDTTAWLFEVGVLVLKTKWGDSDTQMKKALMSLFPVIVDQTLNSVQEPAPGPASRRRV
jgi:hypothetical protein